MRTKQALITPKGLEYVSINTSVLEGQFRNEACNIETNRLKFYLICFKRLLTKTCQLCKISLVHATINHAALQNVT